MQTSSVLLHKCGKPWQGLLLTASILTFWYPPTTDEITVELVPPQVVEGENVLFLVNDLPNNLITFAWFKRMTDMNLRIALYALNSDANVMGAIYSGRATVYRNGSLEIHSVTQNDIGYYTLKTFNRHEEIVSITFTYLHVNTFLWNCGRLATSSQPTVESLPPIAPEGGQVILKIHNPPENIRGFAWFKGMDVFRHLEIGRYILSSKSSVLGPAYSGREKLYSDGSLELHNVTQNDAGLYTLRILGTDMKSEEAHVEIQVDTNPLTSSQVLIEPVPRYTAEGRSVFLLVHNLPKDLQAFSWYKAVYRVPAFKIAEYSRVKNSTTWGAEYSEREIIYTRGSLLLQNVTENDARIYTLEIRNKDSKIERAHVQFYVDKPLSSQPFVRITNTTVRENRSVMFTCVSPDIATSIRWFFNNHNLKLTERMTLSPTKCGLRIDSVRLEDEGEYRCMVANRVDTKLSYPVRWP